MTTIREYIDIIEQICSNAEQIDEYFFYDDKQPRRFDKKNRGSKEGSKSSDVLNARPSSGVKDYGDEYKAMKKKHPERFPVGKPKGTIPEKRRPITAK